MNNPKTTITALVGLIALIIGKYGIEITVETQINLVVVILAAVAYFAKDGNNSGGNSGLAKQFTALVLICVFSVLMTACPSREKTIRSAKEASAQMKIYGINLIQANIDAFRAGEITREQFSELNNLTGKFTEGVRIYGDALTEIEVVAHSQTVQTATLDRLAAIFDAQIVDRFFAILEKLKVIPGANSEAVKTIVSGIRLTILAVRSAFSEAYRFQNRSVQWA